MAKENDREHFEEYREQTRVKHDILEAYLDPYFKIVGSFNKNLIYIDGFAGRGTYTNAETGEAIDGSPLRALKLIAGNETFAAKVSTIFIEVDPVLFSALEKAVTELAKANPQIRNPACKCCKFVEGVRELLDETDGNLAPTFLFVDPCGVSGTCFETIKRIMACESSESFIFFNIDGVRRIFGLDNLSEILVELLGSKDRAEQLSIALQREGDTQKREQMILQSYREALRDEMGVTFSIPFRVESKDKQRTSHYLIHATNHKLGFKIMKDVMWNYSHSEQGDGTLEFIQASRTNYIPLFDPNTDIKEEILKSLATGPQCVDFYYFDWVYRPDDLLCQPAYRKALLELEAQRKIEVLDKDGVTPKLLKDRRKFKGKPTLGEGYYVRLITA